MDRPGSFVSRRALAALACAALLLAAGCNVLATGMYVLTGNNTPADFSGLQGKRVAVVCRPVTALQYRNSTVSRDLAKQVGTLLEQYGAKISVINQREISEWADENNWEDFQEIGKAVGAEVVVGIDLEQFSLYQGQTLYQGKANVTVGVYEVKHGDKDAIFERSLPQMLYPPSGGIPASEKSEHQFRRQFISMLAERIARHFYDHDTSVDFASDSTALN